MPESDGAPLVPLAHRDHVGPFPQGRAPVPADLWFAHTGATVEIRVEIRVEINGVLPLVAGVPNRRWRPDGEALP